MISNETKTIFLSILKFGFVRSYQDSNEVIRDRKQTSRTTQNIDSFHSLNVDLINYYFTDEIQKQRC